MKMNPECRSKYSGPYKMTTRDKVYYWGGSAVILLLFLCILTIGFFYFFDANPALVILDKPVAHVEGSMLALQFSYCKNTDMPSRMTHCFVDGLVYCTPEQSGGILMKGCHYNQTFRMVIPKALPKGEYTVVSTRVYHVNPFATRVNVVESTKFNITREPSD